MANTIRVLHVLDHSLPQMSGYAMRSQSIVRCQQRCDGLEPIVLTSPRQESVPDGRGPQEIEGVRFHRAGWADMTSGWRATPLLREYRQIRQMQQRVLEVAQQERVDVIHAHSPSLNGLPALRAGRALNVPVVYEVRAFWEDAAVDQGKFRCDSWRYRLSRAVESWLLQRVQQVTVICAGLQRELIGRNIPSERLTIIPNGVVLDEFPDVGGRNIPIAQATRRLWPQQRCAAELDRPATSRKWPGECRDQTVVRTEPLPEERLTQHAGHSVRDRYQLQGQTVLGFIGSFYRYEGLLLLLQSVAELRRTHPEVRLLLVGSGEMQDAILEQVRALHLESHVHLAGPVAPREVRDYYAVMDVCVYPRLSERITEFVTPLKPLEAMALRKLVIGSNVGGIAELVEHGQTGYLFQAGSCADLTATLQRALSERDRWPELLERARRYVEACRDWDTIVPLYRGVYERALAAYRRPVRRPSRVLSRT